MKRVLALMVAAVSVSVSAYGQEEAPATRGNATADGGKPPANAVTPPTSVTTGVLHAAGKEIAYTATAGYMGLKDERDKLRANIFYMAYTQGTEGAAVVTSRPNAVAATNAAPATARAAVQRPITFVFNGGPGAASAWLHIGTAGPKRIEVPENGTAPAAPYQMVENSESWLPATDIVCVDPVNTGYSRAATPEQAKEFFGVHEDIQAMGEFIRLYLTKNRRWGSPVYLAGESYGTTRAAGLADYLQERTGVSVSGIILISTVLNFAVLSPGENNELPFALYLPSYAGAAWYHKKAGAGKELNAWLAEAEAYATSDYLVALAKGGNLGAEERAKVAGRLAELTGLKKEYVLETDLRILPQRFEKELLRSTAGEGTKLVGRFDARLVGFPTDAPNDSQEYDPSLAGFFTAYTSAMNEYLRGTLKFDSELPYEVLSNKAGPWNFNAGGSNGYLYVGDNLRDAMTHNPRLRVLVCSGRFDLATPYFATDYQLSHIGIAPALRKNIAVKYYEGGHMMYHVRPALAQLGADIRAFVTPDGR